ncbi:hypothetical protein LCGC14_2188840 [marine sediment metagenome]|uniref:Uncharacterized protein n=1 Tax=marine sediment metagenome TaxID=412755 RepID=A0A0F9DKB5_9ZZZZ
MTEIEELIKQAEAQKKKWRKPKQEERLTKRSWQEILDGKSSPHLRLQNL